MSEYNVNDSGDNITMLSTGIVLKEAESVPIIDSLPVITSLDGNESSSEKSTIPKYMAPKTIEVRRYRLKK